MLISSQLSQHSSNKHWSRDGQGWLAAKTVLHNTYASSICFTVCQSIHHLLLITRQSTCHGAKGVTSPHRQLRARTWPAPRPQPLRAWRAQRLAGDFTTPPVPEFYLKAKFQWDPHHRSVTITNHHLLFYFEVLEIQFKDSCTVYKTQLPSWLIIMTKTRVNKYIL